MKNKELKMSVYVLIYALLMLLSWLCLICTALVCVHPRLDVNEYAIPYCIASSSAYVIIGGYMMTELFNLKYHMEIDYSDDQHITLLASMIANLIIIIATWSLAHGILSLEFNGVSIVNCIEFFSGMVIFICIMIAPSKGGKK